MKQSLGAAEKRLRTASREERAAAERLEELRAARSDADAEVASLAGEITDAEKALDDLRDSQK